ncbi:hypothetical protein LL06_01695 [Hoeflea sp. BAL378]|mgnify:FL=1|nr:hypothetical protein LL06_01695 [Hoeflea sp. BAL378]
MKNGRRQQRWDDDLAWKHLHFVLTVSDTVSGLQFPDICYDFRDIIPTDLRLGGHIAIGPMMLTHPVLDRKEKSVVGMVAWIIYVMNKGWPFFGTKGVLPMTGGAGFVEQGLPFLRGR